MISKKKAITLVGELVTMSDMPDDLHGLPCLVLDVFPSAKLSKPNRWIVKMMQPDGLVVHVYGHHLEMWPWKVMNQTLDHTYEL